MTVRVVRYQEGIGNNHSIAIATFIKLLSVHEVTTLQYLHL